MSHSSQHLQRIFKTPDWILIWHIVEIESVINHNQRKKQLPISVNKMHLLFDDWFVDAWQAWVKAPPIVTTHPSITCIFRIIEPFRLEYAKTSTDKDPIKLLSNPLSAALYFVWLPASRSSSTRKTKNCPFFILHIQYSPSSFYIKTKLCSHFSAVASTKHSAHKGCSTNRSSQTSRPGLTTCENLLSKSPMTLEKRQTPSKSQHHMLFSSFDEWTMVLLNQKDISFLLRIPP